MKAIDTRPTSTQAGFTLVESVIAIALIGAALIISSALLNSLVGAAERVQVHSALLRETEATVEMMRAGMLPLESGVVSTVSNSARLEDLRITALVEEERLPGLHRVLIRGECRLRRTTVSRTITTMVWRP